MNRISLVIDQKFLETFGTGTLVGYIYNVNPDPEKKLPDEVVLVFPETSLRWREKNGGPDQWIVNEYVIQLLIKDVFWLQAQGVKVLIKTVTVSEPGKPVDFPID